MTTQTGQATNIITLDADEARDRLGHYWECSHLGNVPRLVEKLGVPDEDNTRVVANEHLESVRHSLLKSYRDALRKDLSRRRYRLSLLGNRLRVWRLNSRWWPLRDEKLRQSIQQYLNKTEALAARIEQLNLEDIALDALPEQIRLRPLLSPGQPIYQVNTTPHSGGEGPVFTIQTHLIEFFTVYDNRRVSSGSSVRDELDFLLHYWACPSGSDRGISFNLDRITTGLDGALPTGYNNLRCFLDRPAAQRFVREQLEKLDARIKHQLQELGE